MCCVKEFSMFIDHECQAYILFEPFSAILTPDLKLPIRTVTGGEKSCLNRGSTPGPLAYCASALPTELLTPDILTDFRTPGYPMTYSPSLRNVS